MEFWINWISGHNVWVLHFCFDFVWCFVVWGCVCFLGGLGFSLVWFGWVFVWVLFVCKNNIFKSYVLRPLWEKRSLTLVLQCQNYKHLPNCMSFLQFLYSKSLNSRGFSKSNQRNQY